METLRFVQDVFIPFLYSHTDLTRKNKNLLAKILATGSDWNRKAQNTEHRDICKVCGFDADADKQRAIDGRDDDLEKLLELEEVVVHDEVDLDIINIG